MNKKNYIVFTSFFGLFVVGILLLSKIFGERQYGLLFRFWFKCLFFIPLFSVLVLGIFVINSYCHIVILKNILYVLWGLAFYVLGIFALKFLINWKKEVLEPILSNKL